MAVPFETNILINTQGGIVTRAAKDKQNEWQEARIVRKNTSDNVANLAQLGLIAEHSRVAEGAASPARVQIWNEAIQRFYLEHEPSIVMYLNVCTCGLPLCGCSLEEPRDASRPLLTDAGPKPILRPVDGRHRRHSESFPRTQRDLSAERASSSSPVHSSSSHQRRDEWRREHNGWRRELNCEDSNMQNSAVVLLAPVTNTRASNTAAESNASARDDVTAPNSLYEEGNTIDGAEKKKLEGGQIMCTEESTVNADGHDDQIDMADQNTAVPSAVL